MKKLILGIALILSSCTTSVILGDSADKNTIFGLAKSNSILIYDNNTDEAQTLLISKYDSNNLNIVSIDTVFTQANSRESIKIYPGTYHITDTRDNISRRYIGTGDKLYINCKYTK